jgi:hypothetical protein
VILAIVLALWQWRRRSDGTAREVAVLALAATTILIVLIYADTPASAQGFKGYPWSGIIHEAVRWAMPAAVLAGALTAWAVGRIGRWRVLLEAAAVAAVLDGISQSFDSNAADLWLAAGAVIVVGATGWGAATLLHRIDVQHRALAVATALGLLAVGFGAFGYDDQRRFNSRRYVHVEPQIDWVLAHAPAGHRIGVAGEFSGGDIAPIYPLFGPRLGNHVNYVGRIVHGMLQEYGDGDAFARALRRGRYQLLLVGRGVPPKADTPTQRWALRAHYAPIVTTERFRLYVTRPYALDFWGVLAPGLASASSLSSIRDSPALNDDFMFGRVGQLARPFELADRIGGDVYLVPIAQNDATRHRREVGHALAAHEMT